MDFNGYSGERQWAVFECPVSPLEGGYMFTHIVFFKLNEPTEENIKKAKNILMGMEGNIPQLKSVEVGVDVLHSERSYDLALITKFDSLDVMNEYQVHPYHVNEVLKYIRPMAKASVTVDYEI